MTVRIGIVGAGNNARSHATTLLRTEGVRVSRVYDVDTSRAEELAEFCGARPAPSLDAAISDSDAVYVCTWTAAHRDAVERTVQARRAVFCEKPLAPSLSEAQAMARVVEASGVTNQVGLSLRWRPEFVVLRHLLADPANGQVLTATLHSESPNRSKTLAGWRGDRTLSGGGMLMEVGFHDLDLLGWLLAPVTSVAAFTTTADPTRNMEDGAVLALAFESGAVASLTAVWHDVADRGQARRLQVVCEHAHYELEAQQKDRRLTAFGPGSRHLTIESTELSRMAAERQLPTDPDAAFIRAVEGGRPATPAVSDALAVHQLIDAAYRGAST